MKPLVIFGRSPFINTVDVEAILNAHHTVGFNGFGRDYPVNHLFTHDAPISGHLAHHYYHPHWQRGCGPSTPYQPKAGSPILQRRFVAPPSREVMLLGFRHFITSIALNWAVLNGFAPIYLVGVDHVEEPGKMPHYNDEEAIVPSSVQAHQNLKDFVYQCATVAEIYQTNPAVKNDWALPYKDVSELYA